MLGGRNRRRLGAGLALLAVVGVVIAIVSEISSSPSKRNPGSNDRASDATTVERRDLVQTDSESGTLSYAGPQTVYNRLSGTLTWLPRVGQAIKPGGAMFKVDAKPVILMDGTTPAYRDLTSSDSAGQDIEELNRNLVALGFNPDGIVDRRSVAGGDDRRGRGVPGLAWRDGDRQPLARAGRVPAGRAARLDR